MSDGWAGSPDRARRGEGNAGGLLCTYVPTCSQMAEDGRVAAPSWRDAFVRIVYVYVEVRSEQSVGSFDVVAFAVSASSPRSASSRLHSITDLSRIAG